MTEQINQEIKTSGSLLSFSSRNMEKISTLKFTHSNRRHANQPKTPFELIMGESQKAIPEVFENTKFPLIDEKIKQMMAD